MKPPKSQQSRGALATSTSRANTNNINNSNTSSRDRLAAYNEKVTGISHIDRERTIPALALRSYHLPGNTTWCEDWIQYFQNNHPVFGICCHHQLHPIKFWMRVIILIGSIVFGLAITNIIWLWFHYHTDETYFVVSIGRDTNDTSRSSVLPPANFTSSNVSDINSSSDSSGDYVVTKGMIVLWTVGGGLHALFDNTVWFLTACVCCLPGQPLSHLEKYKKYGSYFVTMAVVLITAVSTLIVVMRAVVGKSHETSSSSAESDLSGLPSGGLLDDNVDLSGAKDPSAYDFLIGYAIELALALFLYFPLVGTVLFSGILGCGKIPILGGRPYDLASEQRWQAEQQRPPMSTSRALVVVDSPIRAQSCRFVAPV